MSELHSKLSRRDFVKGLGVSSAVATGAILASATPLAAADGIDPGEKLDMHDAYSGNSIKRVLPENFYKTLENRPGYIGTTKIVDPGQRFDARQHGFAQISACIGSGNFSEEKSPWGPVLEKAFKAKKQFQSEISAELKEDYIWSGALTNAMDAMHYTLRAGNFDTLPISANKVALTPEEATAKIKKLGHWIGMEMVGICEITEDLKPFFYSKRTTGLKTVGVPAGFTVDGIDVPWPFPYKYCICMADVCDYDAGKALRGPLVEGTGKTSCMVSDFPAYQMECIIRSIGYDAKANAICDTATMSEPIAVRAGLGELGRSGLVISPWGGNFRLTECFTNLPLIPDKPIDFGLQEFCKVCKKCAVNCPAGAISMEDEPSEVVKSARFIGWDTDSHKCLTERIVHGCSTCQAICPWSKPDTIIHEIGRTFGQNKALAPFLVKLDDFFYGSKPEGYDVATWAPWR
ncbi:MAG: reductive dehalogenase [Dehalococcoides mccartyi]|uniref:4Fe-4S double cluster binding domain-containing protein n=1 Tax=Dehalococcoides mccartyi TaxID=61435 RepID=UPI000805EA83|nr:reductive dehalogenase domain-containing protein [Dehalococcoides mccartyi]AQW61969.1 reductive dehalogenase [Dehalococcoides mccartyi]OBW62904.1 MAG: reductive dehalogenase [Dehalococcoides mccartyi]